MICPKTNTLCINMCTSPCPSTIFNLAWECPRCHKIHSPYKLSCDCQPLLINKPTNFQ